MLAKGLTDIKRGECLMFRFAVVFVHALIFLAVTIVGLAGKYNPAPPEPDANYWPWFMMFVIFNLLVIISAIVQLRIKKIWVFIVSVVGLFAIFLLTLQYIWPFIGVNFLGM